MHVTFTHAHSGGWYEDICTHPCMNTTAIDMIKVHVQYLFGHFIFAESKLLTVSFDTKLHAAWEGRRVSEVEREREGGRERGREGGREGERRN